LLARTESRAMPMPSKMRAPLFRNFFIRPGAR
jgi:hypothetical protein